MMEQGYDWAAFGTGFGVALLLVLLLRWRKGGRSDLAAPTEAAVKAQLMGGVPSVMRAQVLQMKAEGRNIEAIKLVREKTGCDLKATKDAVDALR
jgi:ribosomal protein L7/L12